jgi:hypothetical protein
MPTLAIELTAEDLAHIEDLARQCTASHEASAGANTHGPLTPEDLVRLLAEDAALLARRPGSWEAENMRQVLESHGYSI